MVTKYIEQSVLVCVTLDCTGSINLCLRLSMYMQYRENLAPCLVSHAVDISILSRASNVTFKMIAVPNHRRPRPASACDCETPITRASTLYVYLVIPTNGSLLQTTLNAPTSQVQEKNNISRNYTWNKRTPWRSMLIGLLSNFCHDITISW